MKGYFSLLVKNKVVQCVLTTAIFSATVLTGGGYGATVYAQPTKQQVAETPESFTVDVMELDNDGFYQVVGYKQVVSNTQVIQTESTIESIVSAKEDYFTSSGKHVKSVIFVEEAYNDLSTGKAKQKNVKKELTASASKDVDRQLHGQNDQIDELLASELKPELTDFKQTKGFTFADVQKVKDEATKLAKNMQEANRLNVIGADTVSSAGAYDNYYLIDNATGAFTVQALGGAAHKYVRIKGKTSSGNNSTNFLMFKGYIDKYEEQYLTQMEWTSYIPEVGGWIFAIAGLVTMVAGFSAGPAGWASAVINGAATVTTLAGFTSAAYSTYQRLQYSGNAAKYLENARKMLDSKNWTSATISIVNGY